MERSERGDRGVHAGKTVRARIEALHKGQEPHGAATPRIAGTPFGGRGHRQQGEESHLENQQQHVADRDVEIMARGIYRPIYGYDDRVIKKAVNPYPAWPIRKPIVDWQTKLARAGERVALAPKVELINANDEKDADDELNDAVGRCHKLVG